MSQEINDINEINETIISYANGDFSKRITISNEKSSIDAILAGINMLGEELESTTVSRDYFSSIYNAVSDIMIVTDINGSITNCNSTTKAYFGNDCSALMKTDFRKWFLNSDKSNIDASINLLKIEGNSHTFETEIKDSKGNHVPLTCSISKIHNRHQDLIGYLIIAKDITEQKNRDIEEKKYVISEIEKERRRLSVDLHDSLGQEITAARMYINSISFMDSNSDEYKKAMEVCVNVLDNAIHSIREICFNLMPNSLHNGGLIHACNELVMKLSPIAKIEFSYSQLNPEPDRDTQILIFRIIQEFITNSIKHSNCKCIQLKISNRKGKIVIRLKDDGKGFDIKEQYSGNGLHNILSRIEALKSSYSFQSEINKGTKLVLYV